MKKLLVVALFIQVTTSVMAGENSCKLSTKEEFDAKTKGLVNTLMMLEHEVTIRKLTCPVNRSTIEGYLKAYEKLDAHLKLKVLKNRPNKRKRATAANRALTYEVTKDDYNRPVQFRKFPFSDGIFE